MKIEVNIDKKYFFGIIFIFILAVGLIGGYAYVISSRPIPNPGHGLDSIQGYFQGDNSLSDSLGKLCQKDGTNCQAADHGGFAYFNSSGTWIAPVGTSRVHLYLLGGGGGGGGYLGTNDNLMCGGGAGGAGYSGRFVEAFANVTSGTSYSITVGQGGTGGTRMFVGCAGTIPSGGAGGMTKFSNLASAGGGAGGGPNGGTTGTIFFNKTMNVFGFGNLEYYNAGSSATSTTDGTKGGNGFVIIEYS